MGKVGGGGGGGGEAEIYIKYTLQCFYRLIARDKFDI